MKQALFIRSSVLMFVLLSSATYAECNTSCEYEDDRDTASLHCGRFALQFQSGMYPSKWHQRANVLLGNCRNSVPLSDFGKVPSFHKLYRLPWLVGGELSYALSSKINLYAEFNYAQAAARDSAVNTTTTGTSSPQVVFNNSAALRLDKYALYSAYIGTSYYSERWWCDRISFFLGEKVGLVHHTPVHFKSLALTTVITSYLNSEFFKKNTVMSAGAHVGFDLSFQCHWSLVLKGEIVVSGGPQSVRNIPLSQLDSVALGGTYLLVGAVQTELSFPVTLALKYTF